jgi:diphthine-ammonia ligase
MSNVVVSLSGGKDSTYALYLALKESLPVRNLMFIKVGGKAHLENEKMLKLISQSVGIPLVISKKNPADIRKTLQKLHAGTLVSGVMTTSEHIDYYKEIIDPIGVKLYSPLFGKNPTESLSEMLQIGFKMLIIEINTNFGAPKEWLGKELDANILTEIKKLEADKKINPIGEWGEYHTIVLDCPIYGQRVNVLKSKIVWKDTKGYVAIKKAELQPKGDKSLLAEKT